MLSTSLKRERVFWLCKYPWKFWSLSSDFLFTLTSKNVENFADMNWISRRLTSEKENWIDFSGKTYKKQFQTNFMTQKRKLKLKLSKINKKKFFATILNIFLALSLVLSHSPNDVFPAIINICLAVSKMKMNFYDSFFFLAVFKLLLYHRDSEEEKKANRIKANKNRYLIFLCFLRIFFHCLFSSEWSFVVFFFLSLNLKERRKIGAKFSKFHWPFLEFLNIFAARMSSATATNKLSLQYFIFRLQRKGPWQWTKRNVEIPISQG